MVAGGFKCTGYLASEVDSLFYLMSFAETSTGLIDGLKSRIVLQRAINPKACLTLTNVFLAFSLAFSDPVLSIS